MRRWRFFRNSRVKFANLSPETLRYRGCEREMIVSRQPLILARCCSTFLGPRCRRSRSSSASCRYYEKRCRRRRRACNVRSWGTQHSYKTPGDQWGPFRRALVSGGTIVTTLPELGREPLTLGLASCDSGQFKFAGGSVKRGTLMI